jgi:tellurite resistance protein TerC
VNQIELWVGFNLFVGLMLVLDLFVFNRRARAAKVGEALVWSALWIGIAAVFGALIYFWQGRATGLEFATGYVIELSLSVDNLFIFILIFTHFRVPEEYQHRVLFWGVVGALVMRAIFIFAGVSLLRRFAWIIYPFGALLISSGIRLLRKHGASIDLDNNFVLRWLRRVVPVTADYRKQHFFVREPALSATPLFVVLLLIELTDVLFATDSIPAILAITNKTFIIYSSNALAIMGLRSMFFALSGVMKVFHYLHYGLSVILIFIGTKMMLAHYYPISTSLALGIVGGVLLISVLASIIHPVNG